MLKKRIFYTWKQFDNDVVRISKFIKDSNFDIKGIYGIPKGGLPLATVIANSINKPLLMNLDSYFDKTYATKDQVILVLDDIVDSGDTMSLIPEKNNIIKISLFWKKDAKLIPDFYCRQSPEDVWISFPWEPKSKKMMRDKDG